MPDWLWQGLLFLVAGAILGLAGNHLYYRKSKEVKELLWSAWTANILYANTSKEGQLSIRFKDVPVQSLSVSWVMLWNNGREAVQEKAIPSRNPLRIVALRGATILEARVVAQSDEANNVSVALADAGEDAVIRFDYLNYREGAVFSLMHTGKSPRFLSVSGAVIDSDPPRQVSVAESRVHSLPQAAELDTAFDLRIYQRGLLVVWAVGFVLLIISVAILIIAGATAAAVVTAIAGFFVLVFGGAMVAGARVRYAYKMPRGLEQFDDPRVSPDYWDRWVQPRELFM